MNSLIYLAVATVFAFMILWWLVRDRQKSTDAYREANDPAQAERMVRKDGVTPPFGIQTIVVSPGKWILIDWDKFEDRLVVYMPPQNIWNPDEIEV